ncbi:cytidine/deoxycytidylate deaminase family protein [Albibacterium indicum]|uniref:hypothetical protein n=1 Tax=Albibacterium indicum TaxID=2292082 RepID=UPI0013001794|nr:hypothetical protein [Pedobacter indicus]
MSLNNFYSLRNSFLVLGLTGRTGGGGNEICEILKSKENPFYTDNFFIPNNLHVNEIQKFQICRNILIHSSNEWRKFTVIKYRDIVLLFFLEKLYNDIEKDFSKLTNAAVLAGFRALCDSEKIVSKRLGQDDESNKIVENIFLYFKKNVRILEKIVNLFRALRGRFSLDGLTNKELSDHTEYLNTLFFGEYAVFAKQLFELIDSFSPVIRQLFLQDVACNLRATGRVDYTGDNSDGQEANYIFTIASAIKNIIKINRKTHESTRIVIDSLKNSLEINFFRERYAGFYLIASNRDETEVDMYIKNKVEKLGFTSEKSQEIVKGIKGIDKAHYGISDFKKGDFTTPDVENCIQKADYYIYIASKCLIEPLEYNSEKFRYLSLELQILKFLALIYKPGIVTPSAIERSMQLAFSSKYNSGCISRQVGAVITDSNYSVKAIGWNEVPQGQTPCSLRNLKELVEEKRPNVYSEYEKEGGNYSGKSFKERVNEVLIDVYGEKKNFFNNLDGHNCPFCFKDFHNSFEGKENQVHTRSLHAEENAMLQISKFGGQPLNSGILFTTASPCELCSKKAFQLGIKKIFYIDPYPGISQDQILKAGNKIDSNPQLFMFQGAVGRGYFKLYEPYMSLKDETYIRTGIKPKMSEDKIFVNMKNQLLLKFPGNKSIESIVTYDELVTILERGLDKNE